MFKTRIQDTGWEIGEKKIRKMASKVSILPANVKAIRSLALRLANIQ